MKNLTPFFIFGTMLCLTAPAFAIPTNDYNSINPIAGRSVLYEVQMRAANACDPSMGSDEQKAACRAKPSPVVKYRNETGDMCSRDDLRPLEQIKLGTFEDMTESTTDFRKGITLDYIHDRLGANMLWLMPVFPNNDRWNLPSPCDNLGSPYAVRDYMHASGMLSRFCISQGKDEHDENSPCWGTNGLDKLILQAHRKGLKVMMDIALNHFGHNYQMYDYGDYMPIRDRLSSGQNIEDLWKFDQTFEAHLLKPHIIDSVAALMKLASKSEYHKAKLAEFQAKCPALQGQELVRSYHMWQNALDWERANFSCDAGFLEQKDPGFYLSKSLNPATNVSDMFSNDWHDVKFIFHHEENKLHHDEFVRNREYLFRIVNYWVSRGVDGFRFDHTTDPDGGMGPNEWKYIISKVDYYAFRRGQPTPVYLAEEFGDQMGMSHVVDVMTDGYVGNMKGIGKIKDAQFVEDVLQNNNRFHSHTYVMTGLETHDEKRILTKDADGITGFGLVTGAGFWGIGATVWSTPMLLMGQEFGETYGLGFRRSDLLRSRFVGTDQYQNGQNNGINGDQLADLYAKFIHARLDNSNRALIEDNGFNLRPVSDDRFPDSRIYAAAKMASDGNVVFVFHNLWLQDVKQNYKIPGPIAGTINDSLMYRKIDVISGQRKGDCISGDQLKREGLYLEMDHLTIAQWLRLELCTP